MTRAAGARRARQGRRAHRLAQPRRPAGRPRGRRACSPMPAPRCSTCSRATPIRPPMPPPCASWRCGACAIRPIVAPWDEASGADGLFLDITGCAHLFGGEARAAGRPRAAPARLRALPAPGHRRHGRRGLGHGAPWPRGRRQRSWPSGEEAQRSRRPCRSPRSGSRRGTLAAHAPARLQAHRRAHRPAARAVCRALRARIPAPPRPGAGARARAAGPRRRAARLSRARARSSSRS